MALTRPMASALIAAGALAAVGCGGPHPGPSPTPPPSQTPAWSDEFDGAANAAPDASKWTYDVGNNGGWGNQELRPYTTATGNVPLDGQGHLVIRRASAGG